MKITHFFERFAFILTKIKHFENGGANANLLQNSNNCQRNFAVIHIRSQKSDKITKVSIFTFSTTQVQVRLLYSTKNRFLS